MQGAQHSASYGILRVLFLIQFLIFVEDAVQTSMSYGLLSFRWGSSWSKGRAFGDLYCAEASFVHP